MAVDYEKDVFAYDSNSYINHGKAVYIIIAKAQYSLRLMICTLRVMIYHCFRNG